MKNYGLNTGFRRAIHGKLLLPVAAFAIGVLFMVGGQMFFDNERPAVDGVAHTTAVQIHNIAESEQWITNYDCFVAPVESVRTSSSYLVMILVPKPTVSKSSLLAALAKRQPSTDYMALFELTGPMNNGGIKRISIDASLLSKYPDVPMLMILDYKGHSIAIRDGRAIDLQSRPASTLPSVP